MCLFSFLYVKYHKQAVVPGDFFYFKNMQAGSFFSALTTPGYFHIDRMNKKK